MKAVGNTPFSSLAAVKEREASISSSVDEDAEEAKENIGELVRIPTKTSISGIETNREKYYSNASSNPNSSDDFRDDDEDDDVDIYGNNDENEDDINGDKETLNQKKLEKMKNGYHTNAINEEEDEDADLREAYDIYISFFSNDLNPNYENVLERLKIDLLDRGLKVYFDFGVSSSSTAVHLWEASYQAMQSSKVILYCVTNDAWKALIEKQLKSKACVEFYTGLYLQSTDMIIPLLLDPIELKNVTSSDHYFCLSNLFREAVDFTKVIKNPEKDDERMKKVEELNHRYNLICNTRNYFHYPRHYLALPEYIGVIDHFYYKIQEFQIGFKTNLFSVISPTSVTVDPENEKLARLKVELRKCLSIFQIPTDNTDFFSWIDWSKSYMISSDFNVTSTFVKTCMKHSHFIYFLVLLSLKEILLLTQLRNRERLKNLYVLQEEHSNHPTNNPDALLQHHAHHIHIRMKQDLPSMEAMDSIYAIIYGFFPEFHAIYPYSQAHQDVHLHLNNRSLFSPYSFRWMALYYCQYELKTNVIYIANHEIIHKSYENHSCYLTFPQENVTRQKFSPRYISPFHQIKNFSRIINYVSIRKDTIFSTIFKCFASESHLGDYMIEFYLSILKSLNRHFTYWKLYINFHSIYVYLHFYEHFYANFERMKEFAFDWEKYEISLLNQVYPPTSNHPMLHTNSSIDPPNSRKNSASSFSLKLSFNSGRSYSKDSQHLQLTILKVSQYINRTKHKTKLLFILISQIKSILIENLAAFITNIDRLKFMFDDRMCQITHCNESERNELIPFLANHSSEIRREYRRLMQLIDRKRSRITIKLLKKQLTSAEDEIKIIINDWNDVQDNLSAIVSCKYYFYQKKVFHRCVLLSRLLLHFLSLKNSDLGMEFGRLTDPTRKSSEFSVSKYHRASEPMISVNEKTSTVSMQVKPSVSKNESKSERKAQTMEENNYLLQKFPNPDSKGKKPRRRHSSSSNNTNDPSNRIIISSPLLSKINSFLPMTSYKYTTIFWNQDKYFIYALQKIPLTNLFIYECTRRYFSILYNAYEIQYSFLSKLRRKEIFKRCYNSVKELNIYAKQLILRRGINIDWTFEIEIIQQLAHLLLKFVEKFRDL